MSKKDEILIIGNGRSVLDYSFGEEINKFPVVGRINNFCTKKYDNYVGQKTDIWFNGANQNLKKRNSIPSEIVILIPPEILQRKGEAIDRRRRHGPSCGGLCPGTRNNRSGCNRAARFGVGLLLNFSKMMWPLRALL